MNKYKLKFCEKARIIVAKDLEVPPDDIDMVFIINCLEKAVKNSVNNEIIIDFKKKKEEEAFLDGYGEEVVDRVFSNEPPFINFISSLLENKEYGEE